jgi:hypothetical protein
MIVVFDAVLIQPLVGAAQGLVQKLLDLVDELFAINQQQTNNIKSPEYFITIIGLGSQGLDKLFEYLITGLEFLDESNRREFAVDWEVSAQILVVLFLEESEASEHVGILLLAYRL